MILNYSCLLLGVISLLLGYNFIVIRKKLFEEKQNLAENEEKYSQLHEQYMIESHKYSDIYQRYMIQTEQVAELQQKYNEVMQKNATLESVAEANEQHLNEKIKYLEQMKEELTLKFKSVSQEIIKAQHDSFTAEQKTTLSSVLSPFTEQLSAFKQEITTTREQSIKNKSNLDVQLKNLLDLNQNLSKDAQNLTDALKGGKKMQGNWGECQLERVLEISGMRKGQDYETQSSFVNENQKTYRPDAIVHLPENRDIIIDSKVSLNAYLEAVNAEDEGTRLHCMQKNVSCIKAHIDELSVKEYQTLLGDRTLNYVIMFIPVESAYIAALDTDKFIYDYAYNKNIILATPLSLLPTLRTIQNLWQINNQNQNVLKIAEHGGKIYDKLSAFLEDMKKLERGLTQAQNAYTESLKKLFGKGGAVSHAEMIKKLGAKTNKSINNTLTDTALLLSPEEDEESETTSAE